MSKICPIKLCPSLRICGQLPVPIVNGGGDNFWKWMDSNLAGLVTLTLDRVILHTVVHQSSTSTYMPNFIEIKETCGGRMYVRTFETGFIRSTLWKNRPKKSTTWSGHSPSLHCQKHHRTIRQLYFSMFWLGFLAVISLHLWMPPNTANISRAKAPRVNGVIWLVISLGQDTVLTNHLTKSVMIG